MESEGFYPCNHNHSINHSKAFLNSRKKKFWYVVLNLGAYGRKGKEEEG
jgi:hypothetical protein